MSSIYFPRDILRIVQTHLDLKSKFNCLVTCKLWNSIFNDDEVKMHLCIRKNLTDRRFERYFVFFSPKNGKFPYKLPYDSKLFGYQNLTSCFETGTLIYYHYNNVYFKFNQVTNNDPEDLKGEELKYYSPILSFRENNPISEQKPQNEKYLKNKEYFDNILKMYDAKLLQQPIKEIKKNENFTFIIDAKNTLRIFSEKNIVHQTLSYEILKTEIWNDCLLTFSSLYGISFYKKNDKQNFHQTDSIDYLGRFEKIHDSAIISGFLIISYNDDRVSVFDLLRKKVIFTETLKTQSIKIFGSQVVFDNNDKGNVWDLLSTRNSPPTVMPQKKNECLIQ